MVLVVLMPSSVASLVDKADTRTMRPLSKSQPLVSSMKSPTTTPCEALKVATAGLALVMAVTVNCVP